MYTGFVGEQPVEATAFSSEMWIARNNKLLGNSTPLNLGIKVVIDSMLTPRKWLDENKEEYTSVNEIKSIYDTKFNGREAVEMTAGGNIASVYKLYVVQHTDQLVVITQDDSPDVDRILSTFKFIE